jgi:multicomponent Na+:H+ antiporter subunit G
MSEYSNYVGSLFLFIGSIFCLIGTYGMYKFNNIFQRMHAASVVETLGSTFILLGFVFLEGVSLISIKIFFIFVLLYISGPTSTNILAKIALPEDFKTLRDKENKDRSIR